MENNFSGLIWLIIGDYNSLNFSLGIGVKKLFLLILMTDCNNNDNDTLTVYKTF